MSSRRALRQVTRRLTEMGVPGDKCADVEIVLAEVLNNIAEHAYAGRNDGPLEMRGHLESSFARFEIIDEGVAMPGLTPPMGAPVAEAIAIGEVPEGGFGWHLIRSLAGDFNYARDGRYNFTSFELSV